jgi:hypothetical protein
MGMTKPRLLAYSLVLASLPVVSTAVPVVGLANPLGPCPGGMVFNTDTNQCEPTPVVGPGGPGPVGPGPVGPGPVGPGPVGPGR